jgi:hypothetical protein
MNYYYEDTDYRKSHSAKASGYRQPWTAYLQTPFLSAIYLISAIVSLGFGQGFLSAMFALAWAYANPLMILQLQSQWRRSLLRWRLNPVMTTGVVIGVLGGVLLGFSWVDAAHAQFFKNAESFLTTNFTGLDASIIKLVMNTIRALFIMYLIFALVQVVNAARQGEEWKDLAKTPFIILIIGVLGDALTGAIAGTGGAA